MNITSLREKEFEAKEGKNTNESKLSKLASSSTSTRQWAGSRNPRIVRVSRAFGGKDRHSKVCTIRGLRDRRIRLSVPTAIQLYDLQDRLGVGQPSKVVDWLLDVTKHDIDKLPPLQMSSQGDFGHFLQPLGTNNASSLPSFFDASNNNSPFFKGGIKINDGEDQDEALGGPRSKNDWDFGIDGELLRGKTKEDHMKIDQNLDHGIGSSSSSSYINNTQVSVQNFFPVVNQSSIPGYLNNMMMPYHNSYYQCDPSNLSLSQFGSIQGSFSTQSQDHLHNSSNAHHSILAPIGSQLLFCPPATTIPSLFPTYSPYFATPMDNDPRQINHFQVPSSSSSQQHFPHSFPLNLNPKFISSQGSQPDEKDKDCS